MPKREEFRQTRFVLGEGYEDASFVRALVAARGGHLSFDVSPTIDIGEVGGDSGFENAVIRCEPITGFTEVSDVVILSDNDDDPAASFANVCDQIENARNNGDLARNWGQATTPVNKTAGDPSMSIWMWPSDGQNGCLETLLWQVVQNTQAKNAACVDAALQCSGADKWPTSKLDKARIRCFLSLVCRKNPGITLGTLWRDAPNLIPLNRNEFDPFYDFLCGI
jgi:hypothetical protein